MSEKKKKNTSRPLTDQEYEQLLKRIKIDIELTNSKSKAQTLNAFHTLVLMGGTFGVTIADLRVLTWQEVLKKEGERFVFTAESKRLGFPFTQDICNQVKENYEFAESPKLSNLVLHKKNLPDSPVQSAQFNAQFARILSRAGIETQQATSTILKKTFAMKLYLQRGADHTALRLTSKALGHFHVNQTRDFLGIEK